MNSLKYTLAGLLTLVLQSTIVHFLSISAIVPDLTLVFVVYIALRYGPLAGLAAGFLMGLVQDVYSYDTLGAGAMAKTILGYGLGLMEDHVVQLDFLSKVILLGVAFFIHDLLFILFIGTPSDKIGEILISSSLPEGLYTLVLGAIFFYLFPSSRRHV
jgi:rod shape-determining protein MreD